MQKKNFFSPKLAISLLNTVPKCLLAAAFSDEVLA